MSRLTAQESASLAAQLDAEEARIRGAVGSGDTPMPSLGGREQRDEGDLADDDTAQRQDDAMLEHYRMQLADIDAARIRMRDRTYGICVDCAQPIPLPRLQAYPTATRCTPCQRRHENLHAPGPKDTGGRRV